ncbi:MAG: hypothetical protein ACNA7O_15240 [Rhodobacterales bacterium]
MPHKLPHDLIHPLAEIEAMIKATPAAARSQLQADLQSLCNRLDREGYALPERLVNLNRMLTDDEVEAQFDNLPV